MQEKMNEQYRQQQAQSQASAAYSDNNKSSKTPAGDYIDFEEVK